MPEPTPEPPEPLPISALQHWAYCPRQCALIHQEQVFAENLHTLRGQALHARVDTGGVETRAGLRTVRALPLFCDRLGLVGKADVVEFEPDGTPFPVEYKQGTRHKAADIARCDDLQLAAQALCLEEMTGRAVPQGALFYAASRRRRIVPIGDEQRQAVADTARQVRAMLATARMPPPLPAGPGGAAARCTHCSLVDLCQPAALQALAPGWRQRLFDPEA